MKSVHPYFLAVLIGCCVLSGGTLSAQHPVWRNYTINDGLPNNSIFAMMQDSRGFLWVGASNGICKFNGYEFVALVDTSGFAAASVCQIIEDDKGRIWFNRLNGSLWYVENDSTRAWKYNQQIKPFIKKYGVTYRFAVDEAGAVWICSWNGGMLIVKPDGTQTKISSQPRNAFYYSKVYDQFLTAIENDPEDKTAAERFRKLGQTSEVCHFQDGVARTLGRFPMDISEPAKGSYGFGFWPLHDGQYLANYLHNYYIIKDDQLVWSGQKDLEARTMLEDETGNIFMANPNEPHAGLLRFRSVDDFKRNLFDNLLPGKAAVRFIIDKEGGYWVSTRDAGIFYCKNPKLGIYDESNGLPVPQVNSLSTDGRTKIYAGLRQLDVAEFELNEPRPRILPRPPITEMQVLRFDTLTGRLWAANNLCYLKDDHWCFATWVGSTIIPVQPIAIKKISPALNGLNWWASSHAGVFSIDPVAGTGYRILLDSILTLRTYSIQEDADSTLWISSIEGLRYLRNGHFIPPPFTDPNQRFNTVVIEKLPQSVGGGQILSLNGGGLLIRDQKGQIIHLTRRDGLTADLITELDISTEGVIYGCSSAGLNILRKQNNGQWHIETLSVKHGLPSNQVNDVLLLGNEIWIATDGGLVRFQGKPAPALMPAPLLEKFVVNNQPLAFSDNLRLSHQQNNLSIRFYSLHYRSGGDILYRYRLLGADTTFVFSRTREVNFANLASGRYTFEVQAQNEDGHWSDGSFWSFVIRAPWWATGWFRTLVAAALAGAAYLFYKNKIQSIRANAAVREKIRDFETAALRAQMNPHFIFNCLQAIQSFIVQNDRDAATTYLARFAKLVRLALHGSVDGLHTLEEEISMLDNYLHLEQMRFPGKFEFQIQAANLAIHDIYLPPMLVQPFVENALIHGLEKQEASGRIEVIFSQKGNAIEVLVKDNGKGFSAHSKDPEVRPGHKSVGMMLTQKRLELLGAGTMAEPEKMSRRTIFDEQGKPAGAEVRLIIPVEL